MSDNPNVSPQDASRSDSAAASIAEAGRPGRKPARFTLEIRTPVAIDADQPGTGSSSNSRKARVQRMRIDDPWRAHHQLASLSGQSLHRVYGPDTAVRLIDRQGTHGAKLEADDRGSYKLAFDSDDANALYSQVYRERQLALSSAHNANRITALEVEPGPEVDLHAARGNVRSSSIGAGSRADEGTRSRSQPEPASGTQIRLDVLATLDQYARDRSPQGQQRHQLDEAILQRATATELKQLENVLKQGDLKALRGMLDQTQKSAEGRVVTAPKAAVRRSAEQATAQLGPPASDAGQVLNNIGSAATQRPPRDNRSELGQASSSTAKGLHAVDERFTRLEKLWSTEYWFRDRPDRLGFTENWLTLKTADHSAAVIMAMVDRAAERGWHRLNLEGTAEFKREAWIIATARGIETTGHVATLGDREAVKAEQRRLKRSRGQQSDALQSRAQAAELGRDPAAGLTPPSGVPQTARQDPDEQKQQHRHGVPPNQDQSHGRTAKREAGDQADATLARQVDALIDKALRDNRVPVEQQQRLRPMMREATMERLAAGHALDARVFDRAAPRPAREFATPGRGVERAAQRER